MALEPNTIFMSSQSPNDDDAGRISSAPPVGAQSSAASASSTHNTFGSAAEFATQLVASDYITAQDLENYDEMVQREESMAMAEAIAASLSKLSQERAVFTAHPAASSACGNSIHNVNNTST